MVSPFMSFATGALGAVNTQINKYQQTEAAEALAEKEEQKLFERAEFDRATKIEIANIAKDSAEQAARIRAKATDKNKHFTVAGRKILKGSSALERANNGISEFASDEEKLKVDLSDAITGPEVRRHMYEMFQLAQNLSMPSGGKNVSAPDLLDLFPVIKSSPLLTKMYRGFRNGNLLTGSTPAGTLSQDQIGGKKVNHPDDSVVKKAAEVYSANRFKTNKPSLQSTVVTLGRKIQSEYNPQIGGYEGTNKYWSAATSPFVKYISTSRISSDAEREAAKEFIYDPKYGFVNAETGRLKDDAFKLINIYSIQDAQAPKKFGLEQTGKQLGALYLEDKSIDDKVKEVKGNVGLATAARTTLTALEEQVLLTGTGSSILNSFQAFTGAMPSFITQLSEQVVELVAVGGKINLSTGQKSMSEKTAKKLDVLNKNLQKAKSSGNVKSVAAAQVIMLKTMLAYQLTSILQGGTGGRTISDGDVERALKMMGGAYDTSEQTMAKLKFIGQLVNGTVDRGKLYNTLQPDDNANKFYAVQKVDALMSNTNTLSLANLEEKLNEKFSKPEGGPVQDILAEAARLGGSNYKKEVFQKGIETVTQGGSGKIKYLGKPPVEGAIDLRKPYVINPDANKMLQKVKLLGQQEGITSSAFTKGLERVQSVHGQIFDITSGKLVNVKYDANGSFDIVEATPDASATVTAPEPAPPPAISAPQVSPEQDFKKKNPGLTALDAKLDGLIKKLFGGGD